MKTKRTRNRITAKACAFSAAMCLLLTSCSGKTEVGVTVTPSVQSRNVISTGGDERDYRNHYAESHDSYAETVASSGLLELRLDKDTNSFAVYDNSAGILWSSLPIIEDTDGAVNENCDAGLVTLRVAGGTDIYVLNSQDNSFAYGKSAVKTNNTGILFTYDMFPNKTTAEKKTYAAGDIGFRVYLDVSISDGNVSVTCTYKNLTGNKKACIEEIELLNYFGAYNDMGEGNFLFVPDGCGAVIKTSAFDESFEPLSFPVYGEDPSRPGEDGAQALIPVFGIKRGNSAFAAIIEKGDAVSSVKAEKAVNLTGYNRAYSVYSITPASYTDSTLYLSKTSTAEEVRVCYRFLSGKNATYAGMASAVREQLIRNSVLSAETAETSDYLPFYITLTGLTKKKLINFTYPSVLTDFDQAKDLITRAKNKGINNITVVYDSVFSGGPDQKNISSCRVPGILGGRKGLNSLYEFMISQNMSLYLNMDILSASKGFKDGGSENIYGSETDYLPGDDILEQSGLECAPRTLRKIKDLKKVVAGILAGMRSYDFTGYCLNDAGSVLYSDFSQGGVLRQDASGIIASTISPLSTSRKVMVNRGNFYMLKNLNGVMNLPLTTSQAKSGSYIPVPFVQIVLHGIANYTGEAVNTLSDTETMLKYIEYGACPHYQWNYTPVSGNGENDIFYYENTVNSAAEFYGKIDPVLNDLQDARITNHYEVEDGVFCTEYDTGTLIYVNYTSSAYTVLNGVDVEPGSFLRVN